MSLMDTIKGAREEVDTSRGTSNKPADNTTDAAGQRSQQGFTRRSATKAKPSRRQAAGVRMVTSSGKAKSKVNQTKEERKAERKHDREVGDLRYNVTEQVLRDRSDYQAAHKVWWRLLIAGVILMVAAVALYLIVSNMGTNAPEILGVLGLVTMVSAYIVVIIGLIYDWRKIRPLRREAEKYVDSMSEKRLIAAINKGPKTKK